MSLQPSTTTYHRGLEVRIGGAILVTTAYYYPLKRKNETHVVMGTNVQVPKIQFQEKRTPQKCLNQKKGFEQDGVYSALTEL